MPYGWKTVAIEFRHCVSVTCIQDFWWKTHKQGTKCTYDFTRIKLQHDVTSVQNFNQIYDRSDQNLQSGFHERKHAATHARHIHATQHIDRLRATIPSKKQDSKQNLNQSSSDIMCVTYRAVRKQAKLHETFWGNICRVNLHIQFDERDSLVLPITRH